MPAPFLTPAPYAEIANAVRACEPQLEHYSAGFFARRVFLPSARQIIDLGDTPAALKLMLLFGHNSTETLIEPFGIDAFLLAQRLLRFNCVRVMFRYKMLSMFCHAPPQPSGEMQGGVGGAPVRPSEQQLVGHIDALYHECSEAVSRALADDGCTTTMCLVTAVFHAILPSSWWAIVNLRQCAFVEQFIVGAALGQLLHFYDQDFFGSKARLNDLLTGCAQRLQYPLDKEHLYVGLEAS